MRKTSLIKVIILVFFITIKIYPQKEAIYAKQKIIRISTYDPVWNSNTRDFSKTDEKKEYYASGKIRFLYSIKYNSVNGKVIEYYENGNLKLEGKYLKGVKEGVHKTYYDNKNIESISEYKQGDLLEATIYYKSGKVKEKTTLKIDESGNKIRRILKYFFSEKNKVKVLSFDPGRGKSKTSNSTQPEKYFLVSEYNYKNEKLFGKQKEYHSNGKIKYQKIIDGSKQRKETFFSREGIKSIEKMYKGENFSRDWKFYYPNGSLKSRYCEDYEDKSIDSIFYKTGKLNKVIKINEKNGRIVAKKEFYENENLKLIYELDEKGEKIITNNTFYENGNINCFQEMKKDMIKITCYFENGKVRSLNNYFLEELEGEQKYYHENGNIARIEFFNKGNKNGVEEIYYDNKQVYQIKYWEDGKLMNVKKCYTKQGKKLDVGTLKNGNGTLNVYFEDGELKQTKVYEEGEYKDSY